MPLEVWDFVLGDEFSSVAPSCLNSLLATPLCPFLLTHLLLAMSCHCDTRTLSCHQNPFIQVILMSNFPLLWIFFLFSSCCCQGAALSEWLQAKVPWKDWKLLGWAVGRNRVREWRTSIPPNKKTAFSTIKLHSPEKWKSFVVLAKFKNSIFFMKSAFVFLWWFGFCFGLVFCWFFGVFLVLFCFCGFFGLFLFLWLVCLFGVSGFCFVFLENENASISQECSPTDLSVTAVSGLLTDSLLPLFSLDYWLTI